MPRPCTPETRGGWSRERRRPLIAVERQAQRTAHAPVVERLLLVVDGERVPALPGALLHRDLAAQSLDEGVPLRRREAAELDHGALAADRRHLRRRLPDEDRAIAIEIGFALVPVARVAPADPV
jgi:hypothetical protein